MRLRHLILLLPALLLAGCGDGTTPTSDAAPSPALLAAAPAPSAPGAVAGRTADSVRREFVTYRAGAAAVTYDTAVVPAGATAQVRTTSTPAGVTVSLAVTGMIAHRAYGAHLHTMACTELPDAAGPHYQHNADPAKPSVDPEYANPRNEVWLDFTADAHGAARVSSAEKWAFDEAHPPRSLILHAQLTRTKAGVAGTAGPRVACLTLSTT